MPEQTWYEGGFLVGIAHMVKIPTKKALTLRWHYFSSPLKMPTSDSFCFEVSVI